jgi:cytochrome c553
MWANDGFDETCGLGVLVKSLSAGLLFALCQDAIGMVLMPGFDPDTVGVKGRRIVMIFDMMLQILMIKAIDRRSTVKKAIILSLMTGTLGAAGFIPVAVAAEGAEKAAVCTGCHGPDGRSMVPANPILAGQHQAYLLSALQAYDGSERNHGIAVRLSDADMEDLSIYFSAQLPYQSPVAATGDPQNGKAKTVTCVNCHGADGNSVNAMFPKLAGQHAVYLAKAMRAYKNGARSNALMPLALFESMSDADLDDIAAYFSAQTPQPPTSSGLQD